MVLPSTTRPLLMTWWVRNMLWSDFKNTGGIQVNLNRYLVDSGLYSLKQKQPFNHTLPVYTQSSKDPFMSSPTQQLLGPQVTCISHTLMLTDF